MTLWPKGTQSPRRGSCLLLRAVYKGCYLHTLDLHKRRHLTASNASVSCDPLADLDAFSHVSFLRRRLRRGESVFQAGDRFRAIYAIRSGFFKATNVDGEGRAQVVGFFMRGELFGLEGIGPASHACTASALEDSEVVVLPFALIEDMALQNRERQRQLHAVISREITRDQGMMMLLGSLSAKGRLASFLLNLSARFVRRGYSPSAFLLRMTREDIGSYLGLKLETVSRIFSEFQMRGLLQVEHKHLCILDAQGLQRIVAAA